MAVEAFNEAVSYGMVSCGVYMLCSQQLRELLPEGRFKLASAVSGYSGRNPKSRDPRGEEMLLRRFQQ